MATMTRTKKAARKAAPAETVRMTAKPAEAPDCGVESMNREVPDSGRLKIAEAPDAGEGRQALLDHQFTHGRSQS